MSDRQFWGGYVKQFRKKGRWYFYLRPPVYLREQMPACRLNAATLDEAMIEAAKLLGTHVPQPRLREIAAAARLLITSAMPIQEGDPTTRVVWAAQFDRLAAALDRLKPGDEIDDVDTPVSTFVNLGPL